MGQPPVMVADLGGTSLRVGVLTDGALLHKDRVATDALPADASLWLREWLASLPSLPAAACVAAAGPVRAGCVRMTNAGVHLRAADLPLPTVLVNDLHGAAMGLEHVPPDRVVQLGGGVPDRLGPMAVLGVGTGLGEALRIRDRVIPGEGGHGAYAPVDADGAALHAWLLRRHGTTEWEDVAAGTSLRLLLDFACERLGCTDGVGAVLDRARALGEPVEAVVLDLADDHPACALALRLMLSALGTEAGNAGLRHLALGGVWLIGGMVPRLRPWLEDPEGAFSRAFVTRRGRYADIARGIPRLLVLDDDVALYGAGVIARRLLA